MTVSSMRSVPSFDSALPWWIRTAEKTTNENSWRNSDCQFSKVDWPNCTRKWETAGVDPCALSSWMNVPHSATAWPIQLTTKSARNESDRPKFAHIREIREERRSARMALVIVVTSTTAMPIPITRVIARISPWDTDPLLRLAPTAPAAPR